LSAIDVESLLQPVSENASEGEDLEYDPAFGEMTRAAEEKPEQQMGEAVIEAQEPDWREVRDRAVDLLSRTKDLRVGVYLAGALCHTDGLIGLNDGLSVVRGLLERHWDTVFPQLDPDDDNDPTMRVNALLGLTAADSMLQGIRVAPLVSSRALGRYSLRDVEIATGVTPAAPDEENLPETAAIDAAFMDTDLEELQATALAVEEAMDNAVAIDSVLTERVGAGQAPDLSALPAALKGCRVVLSEKLAQRGVGAAEAQVAGSAEVAKAEAAPGEVRSREDVIRLLDKACDYFERHEPSSPVPLLLRRAKRLVSKDFMEILRDMAPDGVQQAETIGGLEDDSS